MAQTHQIGAGALKVDRSDSILLLLIFSVHIHCFDNNIVIVSRQLSRVSTDRCHMVVSQAQVYNSTR